MTWFLLLFVLWFGTIAALAQQLPVMSCEDKLAIAEKTTLVIRDERDRWQAQMAAVWLRAEKAEAEVARLQAEARAQAQTPAAVTPKENK